MEKTPRSLLGMPLLCTASAQISLGANANCAKYRRELPRSTPITPIGMAYDMALLLTMLSKSASTFRCLVATATEVFEFCSSERQVVSSQFKRDDVMASTLLLL
jgi:hypothetical protein